MSVIFLWKEKFVIRISFNLMFPFSYCERTSVKTKKKLSVTRKEVLLLYNYAKYKKNHLNKYSKRLILRI